MKEIATIQFGSDFIEIPLDLDNGREVATLQIDGVSYHFERIRKKTLLAEYKVNGVLIMICRRMRKGLDTSLRLFVNKG